MLICDLDFFLQQCRHVYSFVVLCSFFLSTVFFCPFVVVLSFPFLTTTFWAEETRTPLLDVAGTNRTETRPQDAESSDVKSDALGS